MSQPGHMDPWRAFWFEGNRVWGYIDNADEWGRIVAAYDGKDLMLAKRAPRDKVSPDGDLIPNYGLRREHRLQETLAGHWRGEL